MEVLLLNPGWMLKEGNIWEKISGLMPAIGFAYLASYLEKNNVKVKIIDVHAEESTLDEFLDAETMKPDFIGITSMTMTFASALTTAAACRKKFPDAKITLGGVHPTILPEETLVNEAVDYVIRGETEETMKQTMNFAKYLNPDRALYNIATPYPGTEMYKWADENGYLITKDWAKYDFSNAVMRLPTVAPETIEAYYRKAHKDFYGRPGYLFKRLLRIRSLEDLFKAAKVALAVFSK